MEAWAWVPVGCQGLYSFPSLASRWPVNFIPVTFLTCLSPPLKSPYSDHHPPYDCPFILQLIIQKYIYWLVSKAILENVMKNSHLFIKENITVFYLILDNTASKCNPTSILLCHSVAYISDSLAPYSPEF